MTKQHVMWGAWAAAVVLALVVTLSPSQAQTVASFFTRIVVSGNASIGGAAAITGSTTMNGTALVSNVNPIVAWNETDGSSDSKNWRMIANGNEFFFQAGNDANSSFNSIFRLTRATNIPVEMVFTVPSIQFNGNGFSSDVFLADINFQDTGAQIGTRVRVGRNQAGTGAAGNLWLLERGGTARVLWAESGLLRIHTAAPTTNNTTVSHTAGTVVGDQTSFLASKDLHGQPKDRDLLSAVLRTKVHRFTYKDGRYNGEMFTGIVTDESPWFAKDQGKALNEINGLGYLVGAVRELERRLAASEARVRALEARTVVGQ
jgi:hypothetical protein